MDKPVLLVKLLNLNVEFPSEANYENILMNKKKSAGLYLELDCVLLMATLYVLEHTYMQLNLAVG